MACTRFKYDKARTIKELQQSTDPGRYVLNVPGNGSHPCFMENPSIRLQKWGANVATQRLEVENDLLGINRTYVKWNNEIDLPTACATDHYKTCSKLYRDQARSLIPSRENDHMYWNAPIRPCDVHFVNRHVEQCTRLTEKDAYERKKYNNIL